MKIATLIAFTGLTALALAQPARAQFSNPLGSMSAPSMPSVQAPSISMPSLSAPSIPSASSLPSIPSLSSMPSLSSASPSNIAGLLKYCVENNYLSGNDATAAQSDESSLVSQDNVSDSDPGYASGSDGELNAGGQAYNVGGDSGQSEVTQQVCSQVLSHAQSLL